MRVTVDRYHLDLFRTLNRRPETRLGRRFIRLERAVWQRQAVAAHDALRRWHVGYTEHEQLQEHISAVRPHSSLKMTGTMQLVDELMASTAEIKLKVIVELGNCVFAFEVLFLPAESALRTDLLLSHIWIDGFRHLLHWLEDHSFLKIIATSGAVYALAVSAV